MDQGRESRVRGKVLSVYFYGRTPDEAAVIFAIVICPDDGSAPNTVFYIEKLSLRDRVNFPGPAEEDPSRQARGPNVAVWQARVCATSALIRPLMQDGGAWVTGTVGFDGLLTDVCFLPRPTSGPVLSGAFLYAETQQLGAECSAPPPFFTHLYRSGAVVNLELYIKTSAGTYSCEAAKTATKRPRPEGLQLGDLFRVCERILTYEGQTITVRWLQPSFDILWLHPHTVWNGCLPEYFTALYERTYAAFHGHSPELIYVLPGATSHGSPFAPYFAGFPFCIFRVGTPRHLNATQISASEHGRILAHLPGLTGTTEADFVLFGPQAAECAPPCPIECWPLGTRELNSSLCEESGAQRALIPSLHTRARLNFGPALAAAIGLRLDEDDLLTEVASLASPWFTQQLLARYNSLLFAVLTVAASLKMTWVALDKYCIHLVTTESFDAEVKF